MKKKIDFLIDSLGGGGAQKVLIEVANSFISEGYEVKIITVTNVESPYTDIINENIKIESFNKKNILNSIFDLFKYYVKNKNTIFSFSPAISCILNLYSLILGRENKIYSRCLNTLSESDKITNQSFKQKILKIMINKLYEKSKIIIAQSEGMKNDLICNIGIDEKKIIVINNPCNIDRINNLKFEEILNEENQIFKNPTIITVGKFMKQKNQEFLIKIIYELKKIGKKYNLLLLGKGPDEKKLKKLTKELDIEENICFLGFKNNPYKYIEKSNFFFLTSYYEGFPNVMLDALACNKIIFSTDCKSGPSEILKGKAKKDEIIEGEYGYLISLENSDDINQNFINNLVKKLENQEKNMNYTKASSNRIKYYEKNIILQKYKNLIRGEIQKL